MNFQLSNREMVIPPTHHAAYTDRPYLWCGRYGHELYSVKELNDLDLYPYESRGKGPDIRTMHQELLLRWEAFGSNLNTGPRSPMGKGCRNYFPPSVFTSDPDPRKAVNGVSHRLLTYGGGYKQMGSEITSISELTVLLPRNPIDCVPTRFVKHQMMCPHSYGGNAIDGVTMCDNLPKVGTSPIWNSRLCKISEVDASGWMDRIRPTSSGRYEVPDLEYVVAVHTDRHGRLTVNF
jgi:hypothetical protein